MSRSNSFNTVFDRGNLTVSDEVLTLINGTHEEAREVQIARLRRALGNLSMEVSTGNGGLTEDELAAELRAYADSISQRESE